MTITLTRDAFTERIEELRNDRGHEMPVREFVHADGSHTFIVPDFDLEYSNPRDNDGNLATLVLESRDYYPLDAADAGLEEARERWYAETYSNGRSDGFRGFDRDEMMQRYIAMFRPDIACYVDEWSFSASQSDCLQGWGYVTREALAEAGFSEDGRWAVSGTLRMRARTLFDQELDIYQQWASGEVYGGIHVSRGSEVVVYGDEGAYVDGYEADEDSCWGFLGYDDLADICQHFTDSPIVETRW